MIGSGPAGQRVAIQGAKAGKKVAVIEELSAVGGWCVHTGTLPSKSFRESVYRWSLGSRGTLGKSSEHVGLALKRGKLPDMSRLLKRRDRVVKNEAKVIFDQLNRNKVKLIQGRAKLKSPNEVEVTSKKGVETFRAPFIFLAVGARPVAPVHLKVDKKRVFDSDSILGLKKIPKSLVVLGAGIIGCEYASIFSMAGTKVYLIDRRHEILASVDREIVAHLSEHFVSQGMEVLLEAEATAIKSSAQGLLVELSGGRKLKAEVVLISQGRFGNTEGLGLEDIGIRKNERGLIQVDKFFRTSVPNIYAVGDVVGAPALASTSMEQGRIACRHALKLEESPMPQFFPYGIYTIPEISVLGQTEEELIAAKANFVVGKARYRELARGQIVGDQWGLLKLLVEKKSRKLLGVHIVGDSAADLIHIGQAVIDLGGDVNYFIKSVFNYPTLAEAYKTAAFHAVNQLEGTLFIK